jgi:hypothetical protein
MGDRVRNIGPVDQSEQDDVDGLMLGWIGFIQRDRQLNKGRWCVWFHYDPTGEHYAFVDDDSLELATDEK